MDLSITGRAKVELELIGMGVDEQKILLEIMAKFFDTWDSGGAVSVMVPMLARLLSGLPLAPLTGEDSEWRDPGVGGGLVQNIRCTTVFKDISTGEVFDAVNSTRQPVTFPYDPLTRMPSAPVLEIRQ